MKAAIAMSGGVDSSVAAYLLMREGAECLGMTLKLHDAFDDGGARAVCQSLGIPYTAVSERDIFQKNVVEPFVTSYECGRTPNPCVICNRRVKFPLLLDFASSNDCDIAATGHYAAVEKCGGRFIIKKGADASKDQSYMLWSLTQDMLAKLVFPLGTYTKTEIREIAAAAHIPSADSPDSQDICFIPDGDFAGFIEKYRGCAPECGNYLDTDGHVIGTHRGQQRYTVGQNRGLGIALGHKAYVVSKNAADNTVTLGDDCDLYKKTVRAHHINLVAADSLEGEHRLTAKVRYSRGETAATVTQTGEDEITAVFDEPVRAPAPGQSLVIYDGGTLVAGGEIK